MNQPIISARANDNNGMGLASVQFQYSSDGGKTWQDLAAAVPGATDQDSPLASSPYNLYPSAPLPDGNYEARAVATDNDQDSRSSAPVSFTVDTACPITSDVAVTPNPTGTPPTITATITGASDIMAAEYFIDGYGDNGDGTPLAGRSTAGRSTSLPR